MFHPLFFISIYVIPVVIFLFVVIGMVRGRRRERELEKLLHRGRPTGNLARHQKARIRLHTRKD